MESILDFIPDGGIFQAQLDRFIQSCLVINTGNAQTIDDILLDRFGERIRLLKDHADTAAQRDYVGCGIVNLCAVKADAAINPGTLNQIIHPVEAAQQC